MNRTLSLALAGLAACVPQTSDIIGPLPQPASLDDGHIDPTEHAAAEEQAREALDRLDALELLVVGELVVDAPAGSPNCYGLPCVDDEDWQPWMQEHARQVQRLDRLAEVAEEVVSAAADPIDFGAYDADGALDALNALEIVAFEAIDWEQGGNCYVSLCPEDDVRRDQLKRLVAGTDGL